MSDTVRLETEGARARLIVDRPPLNVIGIVELDALADAVEQVDRTPEIRLLRLETAGETFSAGVDIGDHEGHKVKRMMTALDRMFQAFERLAIPSLSVVHGVALGGGCELALATDLCLATERAKFGQPEICLGLFAPPASVLLPRIVGERRAFEMLLTGQTYSAEQALAWGLVNRVVSHDDRDAEVEAYEKTLLALSGEALRWAKRAVRAARDLDERDGHTEVHRMYLNGLMRTDDAHEGLRAFLEKRDARWHHR